MISRLVPASIFVSCALLNCTSVEKNESFAREKCSSCHAFPSPELLDKKTWKEGVLPEMRFRMGLEPNRLWNVDFEDLKAVISVVPSQPMVSEKEWQTIADYYLKNAPDSLEMTSLSVEAPRTMTQFEVTQAKLPGEAHTEITLLKYSQELKRTLIGTRSSKLFVLDDDMLLIDSIKMESPPSSIILAEKDAPLVLTMGNMDPNDQKTGRLSSVDFINRKVKTLFDSLKRPVYMDQVDLNNDGQEDLVVACFGNFTGELVALERKGDSYERHFINNFPGTRKVMIRDINKDGRKDIIALITQGDEQMKVFLNNGDFRFKQRTLLRFSPVHGSSYFDLVDFNNDGFEDIIMCNGDNADFSPILKPYHGVRVYLNDKDYNFKESFFFPMPGAFYAIPEDFDKDGDVDIAAVSYFPDFNKKPEHSFVYLENNGGTLSPYTTPSALKGRWILMDKGDLDKDGDIDIIIGALNFSRGVPEKVFNTWMTSDASVLVLKNRMSD